MLIEEGCPTKRQGLKEVMLFNLLPMGIPNDINILIVGLEYSIKLKAVVTHIKSTRNPVLNMCAYKD